MHVLLVPSADIEPVNKLGKRTLLRLQRAAELLQSGEYDCLILSGGQCHGPEVETQSAAVTMELWLAEQKITVPVLVIEGDSRDTYENISCSLKRLADYPDGHQITVVSQWQHTWRFALTFLLAHGIWIKRVGLHYPLPLHDIVMEWLGILYHLYDWHGTKRLAKANRAKRTVVPMVSLSPE